MRTLMKLKRAKETLIKLKRVKEALGESTLEIAISTAAILTILAILIELPIILLTHPPTKFYYAILFNIGLFGALLHIRAHLIEESEEYRALRESLQKSQRVSPAELDSYLNNKKNWDAYIMWLKLSIGLALLFLFVYILLP
ncbi:MAG: hypothetical protein NDP13_00900 [Crenarchaeota archaeon]|nr:hypothetical protein [Thermoproteota archaeon]